ncbi:MAG: Rho termination factor N-terminal domain-containing protein, partial [Thermoplasmata archaeon]
LEALTVKELRGKAKELSVSLRGRKLKAEIIDAISSAMESKGEEPVQSTFDDDSERPDVNLSLGKLEVLWIGAADRLTKGDYKSTIALSRNSFRLLDEWSSKYRKGMCFRALRAAELFARRFEDGGLAQKLKRRIGEARRAYASDDLDRCSRLIRELEAEVTTLYTEEMGRIRDILVEKERSLEELSGTNTDLSRAHDLLSDAEVAFRLNDNAHALELIHGFEAVIDDVQREGEKELREHLGSVESKLVDTEEFGMPLKGGRKLLRQSRVALESGDLLLAADLAQQCEKSVIQVQKGHMERAMQLRKKYYHEVRNLMSYLKPLLEEARSYGIDIEDVKVLIKQALGHLRQEEYFLALDGSREARRLMKTLQPAIVAERMKRGIVKPDRGECNRCGSADVRYRDDGWGECATCGHRFSWSIKQQPWFISFLRRKLARQPRTHA